MANGFVEEFAARVSSFRAQDEERFEWMQVSIEWDEERSEAKRAYTAFLCSNSGSFPEI